MDSRHRQPVGRCPGRPDHAQPLHLTDRIRHLCGCLTNAGKGITYRPQKPMIDTPHLWLVPVTESSLIALMADQPVQLADIPITVPPEWADLWVDHPGALDYTLKSLQDDPNLHTLGWGGYFCVHRADRALIGMGGFKGRHNRHR